MKKMIGAFVLGLGVLYVTTIPSKAYAVVEKPKITCYSTYNDGTTNFTKCNGCTETTGSSLTDQSTCTK
jgi:hypothetical protein